MKKRIISMLLVLSLLSSMGIAVATAEVVSSGTAASGQKWQLTNDGTLSITGTGAIADYGYRVENGDYANMKYVAPEWSGYQSQIINAEIGKGITHIGANSFGSQFENSCCDNLSTATIADTVTSIGSMAFAGCEELNAIYFYGNAPTISEDTFAGISKNAVFYYLEGTSGWNEAPWTEYRLEVWGESVASLNNFKKSASYITGQFSDVANSVWYAESVSNVYELGLMIGNTGTTFNPSGYITQPEALTIAARLHKIYTTGNDDFTAIKQEMAEAYGNSIDPEIVAFRNAWYAVYVYYLWHYASYDNCILPFIPAGGSVPKINSEKPIVKKEFVYYMYNALPESVYNSINNIPNGAIPYFSAESFPWLYTFYQAGILTGSDDKGTFDSQSKISRAEVAAIISRIALPSLRKSFSLSGPAEEPKPELTVNQNAITISSKTQLLVSVFADGEKVFYECNSDIVSIEWGSWNGWDIPLYITPIKNGSTTIRIYTEGNPSMFETISVTVSGLTDTNRDTTEDAEWMTTNYEGYKIRYQNGIPTPEAYHKQANIAGKYQLKFPAMAKEAKDRTVLIYRSDDDPNDIVVGGWWLGCNSFGVYDYVNYIVVFNDGNLSDYYCFAY